MLSLVVLFIHLKEANMRVIISILFVLISFVAVAQQPKLYAVTNDKGIFVEHKVQPKENWYSVGRLYAISPKEIAAFNGLTMEKGLSIGQALKVPLNGSNFIQTVSAVGVPVYHLVAPKEGLLKVASTYGLSLAGIKNLNNLNSDQINSGYNLIVGYIAAGTPSSAASSITAPAVAQVPTPASTSVATPVKKEEPIAQSKPSSTPPPVKTQEPIAPAKPVASTVATPVPVKSTASPTNYFSTGYNQQAKEGKEQKLDNPVYGVFKSSSGWQDGKYYMLMNEVIPGTIVKVSALESGKTIHAKVLGAVPPGKESEGMQLRLSNAAAVALGVETTGSLSLVWYK